MRNNPHNIYPLPDEILKGKNIDVNLIEKAINEYDIKVWKGLKYTKGSYNLRTRLYNSYYFIKDLLWASYSKFSDRELEYISEFYAVAIKDDKVAQKELEQRKYELWYKVEKRRNLEFLRLKSSIEYLSPIEIINREDELDPIIRECFNFLHAGRGADGKYKNDIEFKKVWKRAHEIHEILLKYIPLDGIVPQNLRFPGEYYAILTYGNKDDNYKIDIELEKIEHENKILEHNKKSKEYKDIVNQSKNIFDIYRNQQTIHEIYKDDKCNKKQQMKIQTEDLAKKQLVYSIIPIKIEYEYNSDDNILVENTIFREKNIAINTKSIENKEYTFIFYDNKEYKFDDFLITMYPDKRINKSVIYLPDTIDNLLKIGPTQRIKMKYDILAYHFRLSVIDEEEKEDLFRFLSKYYENETIQKYYRRFNWDDGLEKMVAFGADLDISGKVDGAIEGFWCYEYKIDRGKAIITGINTSLNLWLVGVKASICSAFSAYLVANIIPNSKQIEKIKNIVLISLYYQQEKHSAIPDIQIGRPIKEVINNCIDNLYRKMKSNKLIDISDIVNKCFSTLSIPDYQSEAYQFTVDFEKDIMIVDTKSAARIQQAITNAYKIAAERLIGLKAGDKITTQQLRDRGYKNNNGKAINTLVEYGILQKGVLRGSYVMLKDF